MDETKPHLARRPDPQSRIERWQIWYNDVHVSTIEQREGLNGLVHWGWSCGFHPGSNISDHRRGLGSSYPAAQDAFLTAWASYLPKLSAGGFDEWRHQTEWTAEKYARWERGERGALPWPLPGFVCRVAKMTD
jgi:hypothetical protein